jgi:hypothetical protein
MEYREQQKKGIDCDEEVKGTFRRAITVLV